MVERVAGMSVDEFIRLYEENGPFEILEGKIVAKSLSILGQSVVANELFAALYKYGEVFFKTPFVLSDDPNWVSESRTPELIFIHTERLAKYKAETPDWREKPLYLIPDLVIEIVSPTDLYSAVEKKIVRYLADGVKMLWIVDFQQPAVVVYRAGSNMATCLTANDSLDGGDIIPGFSIFVASIFED